MHKIILAGAEQRQRAQKLILRAPDGYVVSISEPKRTLEQNAKMHAMLTDISLAKPQGRSLSPDVWKALLMHEAGFKCTFERSIDGTGVVPLGFKSSRLRKAEFSDLIEAMYAFGAEHGIEWSQAEMPQ